MNEVHNAVDERNFIVTVDGTHCRISEPGTEPGSQYYSHKFNKPAFCYEIAVDVFRGYVVWTNGPFPAGNSDLQIYRMPEGLKSKIPENKRVIADNGYRGEEQISIPNNQDDDLVKAFKSRARARHETVNGRIKEFKILDERFRQTQDVIEKHKTAFEAVITLVQYDIENGRPLFTV